MKDKRTLVDRNTVDVEVRGKVFPITFISNYMIREHTKIINEANRALTLYKLCQKAEQEGKTERVSELRDAIVDIGKKDYFQMRSDLIKEILTENGIEYDQNWWDRKTGPDDVMKFLNEAIHKDIKDSKKKAVNR